MIPVNRPLITSEDKRAVIEALDDTFISGESPQVRLMEERLSTYLKQRFSVAVSNGSVALDLAVEALELPEKSECIVPTFTIISTVANLLRKNHKLILIDSDPFHWSMSAESACSEINSKTRLVLPVHIYGLPVDMDPILKASARFETFVLEDSAEALGVNYKDRRVGGLANASVHSFYANKTVTGGEGGAIVTNDQKYADRIRYLRNLCFNPQERFVHSELGWNYRISGLSASLIASQLMRIDQLIEIKQEMAQKYNQGLSDHPWFSFIPQRTNFSENGYWVFPILLNKESPFDAKEFQLRLKERGIETRRFFCPIHLQPLAAKFDIRLAGSMKVSEELWKFGLYLPCGVGTLPSEISQVIDACWELTRL